MLLMVVCGRILAVQVVQFSHFISHLEPKQSCAFRMHFVRRNLVCYCFSINVLTYLMTAAAAAAVERQQFGWQHQAALSRFLCIFIHFPETFEQKEEHTNI